MKLLLASKSAARKHMLEAAGVPFEAVDAPFVEEEVKARLDMRNAAEVAASLAQAKALSVDAASDDLVLGSDQTLERSDGSILHKAETREELADQLRSLSGSAHRLHSSAAIVEEGHMIWSA
ncbi:MAG TPA: Maf family protein, partial [Allosphingosinicella sp.]